MDERNGIKDIVGTVSHMKKKGTLKILIIVLVLGALLFIVGSVLSSMDDKEGKTENDDGEKLIGFFDYKEMIESEIESLCLGISGVRSAKAAVFFEDVGGSIYAKNEHSSNGDSLKSEYVIIGSGSNAHALYLGESLPKLSGIGVVCDTDMSEEKRLEILSLLSSAYGLPMTRIYVSEAG